jgi:hypothetical protein
MPDPDPEEITRLRAEMSIVGAQLAIGNRPCQAAYDVASRLFDAGIYHDDILAVFDGDCSDGAIKAMLECQGVPVPEREAGIWVVLHHHIAAMAAGTLAPKDGISRVLSDIYFPLDLYHRSKSFVGDSHGITGLYAIYHDDMLGPEGIDRELVKEANAWLQLYSAEGPRNASASS